MTRVLVTGGSGFIAAHVVASLLKKGHTVVTTVRSEEKGTKILEAHPELDKEALSYVVVPDMSAPGAFDDAVVSSPPLDSVIHTASPYHFNAHSKHEVDEICRIAVNGTIGILKAIKAKAPTVKRVVVTSSFAAIVDAKKPVTYTYSETDWDPVTPEDAYNNAQTAYRASKTFAERAAWDFVASENPNFQLSTCNPPLVLGPVIHYLNSLSNINTSNERIRDILTGASKARLPPSGNHLWVDVRDIADAHVLAMETPEAVGKRFFITKGNFCNREIVDIVREEFPEYEHVLPTGEATKIGDYPASGVHGWNNKQSIEVLGMKYRELKESIIDTVRSLQPLLKSEEDDINIMGLRGQHSRIRQ